VKWFMPAGPVVMGVTEARRHTAIQTGRQFVFSPIKIGLLQKWIRY
jgi:hypothetical protein